MSDEFSKVRSAKGSQQSGFEELVCQAVRKTDAASAENGWTRIHGAGGDGGVEAFWLEANGKVGVQAKWFLKTADISWSQIEASFTTALDVHQDLVAYRIYLACDLTGPTRKGTRTGVDAWKDSKQRLADIAKARKRKVDVTMVTASDLSGLLSDPRCVGLREYWLDSLELSDARLRGWFRTAVLELGERFHPEDHVPIAAEELFLGLARDPKLFAEVSKLSSDAAQRSQIGTPSYWSAADRRKVGDANKKFGVLAEAGKAFVRPLDAPLPTSEWMKNAEAAVDALQDVVSRSHEINPDNRRAKALAERASALESTVRYEALRNGDVAGAFIDLFRTRRFRVEARRAVVLIGAAGTGKSHLLASAVQSELDAGGTAILMLGHWFRTNRLWEEILHRVGFPTKTERELLGALDARAAETGRRAIIVIDAINESEGPDWRRQLASLFATVREFPNVTILVSCRNVYEIYLVDEAVFETAARVEIYGFQSPEEQEAAARQFLDKRGITRPALPWLAPEFANPLFLRASAVSLQMSRLSEFPPGLDGTKRIFSFFLTAVSAQLTSDYTAAEMKACVPRALIALAREMARQKTDRLDYASARCIVDEAFENRSTKTAWIEILCHNGLLDKLPDAASGDTSFLPPAYRIRFVYQRLQDHLMADALVSPCGEASELWSSPTSSLKFIFDEYGQLHGRYLGLAEAISIQVPERFNVEFIDLVGNWFHRGYPGEQYERLFIESVKWRDPATISKRTDELIAEVADDHGGAFLLLVELCLRNAHPLNAERLHEILIGMKMPARDEVWTRVISEFHDTVCEKLVRWAAEAEKAKVDKRTLVLASIVLTWFLTSTSRWLRDSATKALSSLFCDHAALYPMLLERFASVDDPYVHERLLAAAYGYVLRCGSDAECRLYASATALAVFGVDEPIVHLHARAYAFGIVELAAAKGVYDGVVTLAKCRPPYGSTPPRFGVTEKRVEEIAEKAGGKGILRSCGEWGDFQRYSVASSLGSFVRIPLSSTHPTTRLERAGAFEREMEDRDEVMALLSEYRRRQSDFHMSTLHIRLDFTGEGVDDKDEEEDVATVASTRIWSRERRRILAAVERLLGPADYKRFKSEWLPDRESSAAGRELPWFDPADAGRWIARRAYALGWTAKRFGNDHGGQARSSGRPSIERIGKKYQWIARSELFARLADNYWMHGQASDSVAEQYVHPNDIGFERDIDPSTFTHARFVKGAAAPVFGRRTLDLEERDGRERLEWPFKDSPAPACLQSVAVQDEHGVSWTRLSWYEGRTRERRKARVGEATAQQQVFWHLRTLLLPRSDAQRLQSEIIQKGHLDMQDSSLPEFADNPFIYEFPIAEVWRDLFKQEHQPNWPEGATFEVSRPVELYIWENHLDASLSEGLRLETLAAWWMRRFALVRDPADPAIVRDSQLQVAARYIDDEGCHGTVVRTDILQQLMEREGLEILFLAAGEREAWADDSGAQALTWRRFNGVAIGLDGLNAATCWNEDVRKGDGA